MSGFPGAKLGRPKSLSPAGNSRFQPGIQIEFEGKHIS